MGYRSCTISCRAGVRVPKPIMKWGGKLKKRKAVELDDLVKRVSDIEGKLS